MPGFKKNFIDYALECGVLKFGTFTLKSGRLSPYFFNTGLFNSGLKLGKLGEFYAEALIHAGIDIDVLYGPAYKGITLVSATAIAYAHKTGNDIPFAFNRKEAKDHGEGGLLVGSRLEGKVVIVDDVITAGTSVRESVEIIKQAGAIPSGVICALDRQEKGQGNKTSNQEIGESFGINVISIISLSDIVDFLSTEAGDSFEAVQKYQQSYCIR
jgi:orotate phosphoribosyltransferase